jgi:two-component system, NtrC family, sensor kinase
LASLTTWSHLHARSPCVFHEFRIAGERPPAPSIFATTPPGYLNQLVEALRVEKQGVVDELDQLTKSVDHIKEIVATQQTYAGASSIFEPVQIADLLGDALRMQLGTLTRYQINVIKNYSDIPVLSLDKHRLLLILVNLISNAGQALSQVALRGRELTLSADLTDKGTLRIRVADNGEGIAPDNLTRMFAHGFTTRKDGHGFGLHSCALAAVEMEGTLTAQSDGPGEGAVFTLQVPVRHHNVEESTPVLHRKLPLTTELRIANCSREAGIAPLYRGC